MMRPMQHRIKVYGPPGTGKTKYCLDLLCEHLQAGDRVLFLSFTRAAKIEAENRMRATFGEVPANSTVKTIHALCLRILNIGVGNIYERNKTQAQFYASLNSAYHGHSKRRDNISHALAYHNFLRNRGEGPRDDAHETPFIDRGCTDSCIEHFERWKQAEGYVDFTDLLVRVARGDGEIDHYDVVIIDEAQDLTTLQWKVVERLYAKSSMVYVVGDDDQAVYSFLGADVGAFLSWPCDAMSTLGYTYRLPANVLDFSMRLASQIDGRQAKIVTSADRQGTIIADINMVESMNYGTRSSELYLARNEYMLKRVTRMLRHEGVPYRSASSPYTSSWGYEAKAFQAIAALHVWRTVPLTTKDWKKIKSVLRPSFVEVIEAEHEAANEERPEGIPTLTSIFRSTDEFETEGWWESFLPLLSAQTAAMFSLTLRRYTLAECMQPKLELSTIHGAKGKEADRVYVCSALSDRLHRGIELRYDEHRLFYVAVTRTKDELILINDEEAGTKRYNFPSTEV